MNLRPEDFENNGYRRFASHRFNNAAFGLQKVMRSECGKWKRYFLTVWVYDRRVYKERGTYPQTSPDFGFQPEVTLFQKADNEQGFISFAVCLNDVSTVENIEEYYENVYNSLQCIPDCHNND